MLLPRAEGLTAEANVCSQASCQTTFLRRSQRKSSVNMRQKSEMLITFLPGRATREMIDEQSVIQSESFMLSCEGNVSSLSISEVLRSQE